MRPFHLRLPFKQFALLTLLVITTFLCANVVTSQRRALAAPSATGSYFFEEVAVYGGNIVDYEIIGERVYAGIGRTLTILDISIANHPVSIYESNRFPNVIDSVELQGNRLYVIVAGSLWYTSLADGIPTAPFQHYTLPDYTYLYDLKISGEHGFAKSSRGLTILHLPSSAPPTWVTNFASTFFQTFAVGQNRVYARQYSNGQWKISVIDVSDVETPILRSEILLDSALEIAATGAFLYVATREPELLTYDTSNLSTPELVSTISQPYIYDMQVVANQLIVASYTTLQLYDIANGMPQPKEQSTLSASISDVRATAQQMVVKSNGELLVLAQRDTNRNQWFIVAPSDIASGITTAIAARDNNIYVAKGFQGVDVVNMSATNDLTLVNSYTNYPAEAVVIKNNYLYTAAGYRGLQIYEIGSDGSLEVQGNSIEPQTFNSAHAIAVSGNHAYLLDGSLGLRLINVADPANPQAQAILELDGNLTSIAVFNGYVYVTAQNAGLHVVDVRNAAAPQLIGTINSDDLAVREIEIVDDIAYVTAGSEHGLLIYDLSSPSTPNLLGSFQNESGYSYFQDVTVIEHVAYVSDYNKLTLIDVSQPDAPQQIDAVTVVRETHGPIVLGDNLAFWSFSGGVAVVWEGRVATHTANSAASTFTAGEDGVSYLISADTFPAPTTLHHRPNNPNFDNGMKLLGMQLLHSFSITATNQSLAKPLTLRTVYISHRTNDIPPQNLRILHKANGIWNPVEIQIDLSNRRIIAEIAQLGEYALVGYPAAQSFMPALFNQFVAPDLAIDWIEITQAIQDHDNSVPLVAGKQTVARVHINSSFPIPQRDVLMKLTATRNGSPLAGSPIMVDDWAIYRNGSRDVFRDSYTVLLPTGWTSGDITVEAEIDTLNSVAETNETNNRSSQSVTFSVLSPLDLVLVPIHWQFADTGITCIAESKDYVSETILKSFPLHQINVTMHPPITVKTATDRERTMYELYAAISTLKQTENAPYSTVYYGLVAQTDANGAICESRWAGVGGGRVGVGYYNNGWTAAHELGHGFGLPHAPCGNPGGPDQAYPYPDAKLGEVGFDLSDWRVVTSNASQNTRDTMSYCHPRWFSDYNYRKLYLDQRAHTREAVRSIESVLLIQIDDLGDQEWSFAPLYRVDGTVTEVENTTAYRVELIDQDKNIVAQYPIKLLTDLESEDVPRSLQVSIPAVDDEVASIRLVKDDEIIAEKVMSLLADRAVVSAEINTDQQLKLEWNIEDKPVLIRFSADGGTSWTTLGLNIYGGQLIIDVASLPAPEGIVELTVGNTIENTTVRVAVDVR